jgi:hypothetical protein
MTAIKVALLRGAVLSLVVFSAACTHMQSESALPDHLYFEAGSKTPEDLSAEFAQVMTDRYPQATGADVIKQDLIEQGLVCRDVPPVEARGDYLVAACDITKAGPKQNAKTCDDVWIVALRYHDAQGPAHSMRVQAIGSFERNCY